MIDRHLLPLQRGLLRLPARAIAGLGMTADQMTLVGGLLGLAAAGAIGFGWFGAGLILLGLNRLADGLDGEMARHLGPTDRGAFLDIAVDFFIYALVPFAFALADPGRNALAAALLITSFVGTGSSFLAFAAIAAKRGKGADDYPTKGITYLGGLTEGFETIVCLTAMCLWPNWFPLLASVFAAMCLLTTAVRWRMGWFAFSESDTVEVFE